jgi:filamentous hemagglutinin
VAAPALPRIRGTQIGLRDPALVARLKADMQAGRYAYHEPRGQIGGWLDRRGSYHVHEGHHRIAAALELYRETGDPGPVLQLLRWGVWTPIERPPRGSRPLPARDWWRRFRNWLGV